MNRWKKFFVIFMLASSTASAENVFVNGEWIPCDHPVAKHYGFTCSQPAVVKVQVGKTYRHKKAGWIIYIAGIVQRSSGQYQFVAEVVNGTDVYGRVLFDNGSLIPITSELNSTEWEIR